VKDLEAIDFLRECKAKSFEALERLKNSFSGEDVDREEFFHVLVS
jgi:hypothetical protein